MAWIQLSKGQNKIKNKTDLPNNIKSRKVTSEISLDTCLSIQWALFCFCAQIWVHIGVTVDQMVQPRISHSPLIPFPTRTIKLDNESVINWHHLYCQEKEKIKVANIYWALTLMLAFILSAPHILTDWDPMITLILRRWRGPVNLDNLSKVTCQIIGRGRAQTQGSLSLEPGLRITTLTDHPLWVQQVMEWLECKPGFFLATTPSLPLSTHLDQPMGCTYAHDCAKSPRMI